MKLQDSWKCGDVTGCQISQKCQERDGIIGEHSHLEASWLVLSVVA